MLPSEDVGRGCRLYEGSQIGWEPMGFCNPMGVLLITITYKVFTPAWAPATLCTMPKASGVGYRHIPARSPQCCLHICAYRGSDGRGDASRRESQCHVVNQEHWKRLKGLVCHMRRAMRHPGQENGNENKASKQAIDVAWVMCCVSHMPGKGPAKPVW
jgi:hypothetical protein